jgi:hypothetical protein
MARSLATVVTLTVALGLSAPAKPAAGSALRGTCPVTVPNPDDPGAAPFSPGSFNYGNARIRVEIYWPHGRLIAGRLPGGGVMATVNPDGSIYTKVGWWRGVPGNLVIKGRRLDAHAPPLRADVPPTESYGKTGFIPSGLTFPTVGCWRVVGTQGAANLTFVVKITKVKRST